MDRSPGVSVRTPVNSRQVIGPRGAADEQERDGRRAVRVRDDRDRSRLVLVNSCGLCSGELFMWCF